MRFIVDRIEENFAVVELPDGTMLRVDIRILPDCAEGDMFTVEKEEKETKLAKERADKALDDLIG